MRLFSTSPRGCHVPLREFHRPILFREGVGSPKRSCGDGWEEAGGLFSLVFPLSGLGFPPYSARLCLAPINSLPPWTLSSSAGRPPSRVTMVTIVHVPAASQSLSLRKTGCQSRPGNDRARARLGILIQLQRTHHPISKKGLPVDPAQKLRPSPREVGGGRRKTDRCIRRAVLPAMSDWCRASLHLLLPPNSSGHQRKHAYRFGLFARIAGRFSRASFCYVL
ncbi:hypothetical protein LX36DRAFT_123250 [Colletotrichum falcatum]|nr:hypothetical protein LX36DRAFT_123250 [Colletotrichum falcatum]